VFDWLQEKGNVEDKEMYRTFNMGMGMMIVVDEKDAENALSILGSDSQIIGSVRNGQGVEHGALKTD
jgi:phosphoribosylformylglycinamidine cyclo-ligase